MAIPNLSPAASDLVTVEVASVLLRPTGHPLSQKTLKRLLASSGRPVVRDDRGRIHASMTDVLELHRDWVERTESRS